MQGVAASRQSCSMRGPMDGQCADASAGSSPQARPKHQVGCFGVRWTRHATNPLSRLEDGRMSNLWLLGPTALSFSWRAQLDRTAAVLLESGNPVRHTSGGTQQTRAAPVKLLFLWWVSACSDQVCACRSVQFSMVPPPWHCSISAGLACRLAHRLSNVRLPSWVHPRPTSWHA